jgi:hypothetical protein
MLTSRVHSLSILEVDDYGAKNHVAICSCGWESLPLVNRFDAVMENCAVMEAELEGAERRARRKQLARTAA